MVLKKSLYNKLVTKVNAIVNKVQSTSGLVSKKNYDSDKQNLNIKNQNKEIFNTSGLIKQATYNYKLTDIENKIPCGKSKIHKN